MVHILTTVTVLSLLASAFGGDPIQQQQIQQYNQQQQIQQYHQQQQQQASGGYGYDQPSLNPSIKTKSQTYGPPGVTPAPPLAAYVPQYPIPAASPSPVAYIDIQKSIVAEPQLAIADSVPLVAPEQYPLAVAPAPHPIPAPYHHPYFYGYAPPPLGLPHPNPYLYGYPPAPYPGYAGYYGKLAAAASGYNKGYATAIPAHQAAASAYQQAYAASAQQAYAASAHQAYAASAHHAQAAAYQQAYGAPALGAYANPYAAYAGYGAYHG